MLLCSFRDRLVKAGVTGKAGIGFRNGQIRRARLDPRRYMSKNTGMTGDLRPILPSLIRLLAAAIVLIAVQNIVLGFPGITQPVLNSTYTMAGLAAFSIGLIGSILVLKFGTQLANAAGDAYGSIKDYAPLLGWFFQVAALYILYVACKGITGNVFNSAPWAYPLIFLLLAIIPTVKAVVNVVHALEGHSVRHTQI